MPTQTEDLPEQGGVEDAIDVLPAPPPPPAPVHLADSPIPTPTPTPSPLSNLSPSPPSHNPSHYPPSLATHPPKSQSDVVEQPEQNVEMDSNSPDELDIMSEEELQAEALMFASLIDFGTNAELEDIYLSYEDALKYAFQSSNCSEHVFSVQDVQHISPEPYQWKDIKGRPDADL
ncbi:hypothetical protein A7U60_g384 [Sanghuangporus baumii]|uniref:Uncharacterized protein n=1 Tax=Sanghuangporus baumii TaxID=108892 RepID=A0A9Q5I637_SANBA|nr:hypothetical protein A7U60_g384 [Sanghuangporus baumii]